MTIEEQIRGGLARHPDWDDRKISKSIRGSKKVHVAIIRAGGSLSAPTPVSVGCGDAQGRVPSENVSGMVSMEKVVARYDIKTAILREVEAVPEGALMTEAELCLRAAGQDRNRFRRTVENNEPEFKLLRVKLKLDDSAEGKWYWGKPKTIAEALRIRDL